MHRICSGGRFTATFVIKSAGNVRTVGARTPRTYRRLFSIKSSKPNSFRSRRLFARPENVFAAIRAPETRNIAENSLHVAKSSRSRSFAAHIPERDTIRNRNSTFSKRFRPIEFTLVRCVRLFHIISAISIDRRANGWPTIAPLRLELHEFDLNFFIGHQRQHSDRCIRKRFRKFASPLKNGGPCLFSRTPRRERKVQACETKCFQLFVYSNSSSAVCSDATANKVERQQQKIFQTQTMGK